MGFAGGLGCLALLGGCASPGNPRPPSLHLEQVAPDLAAERLGDQVILTWTTPDATTDGGKPEMPLTAVICRESFASSPLPAPPCTPVLRVPVTPGSAGRAAETLPATLLGTPALLAYRVELTNRRGRSAGLSEPAFAAAGKAPAAAGPLMLSGQASGTVVAWAAAASPGAMQVTRTPASPGTPGTAKPAAMPASPRFSASSGQNDDPLAAVLLRPPDRGRAATGPPAASGLVDASVLDPRAEGIAFSYTAQRIETVTLAGHTLELHGIASPPAVFTYAYTFAPPSPSGLLAVPALSPPEIDLSWEAAESSASAGLLGYKVYRRGPGESAFTLLHAKPVASLSFRDATVMPGRKYAYRVTSVDRHGNESAPSPEVQESVTP